MRWHGRTIGSGLRFITMPTARAAFGLPGARRELAVGLRVPVRHLHELGEHRHREAGLAAQVDGQVERAPASGEVLVELAPGDVDGAWGAEDAGPGDASDLLERRVGVAAGIEGDPEQAAVGRGDEQRADGAVDDVVAGVEELRLDGGVAEAAVEIGGNGHAILLRSRRTPDEVAWRAASGDESSAAAICS